MSLARGPAWSMLLGGIGTGGFAVGADGGLRQWQLHNRGFHRGDLPGSFLALRVSTHVPASNTSMILQQRRDDPGWYGQPATPMVDDDWVPGWQRELVERWGGTTVTDIDATYPVAKLTHTTGTPVQIHQRWSSPLVPGDVTASSVPAVVCDLRVVNTGDVPAEVWVCLVAHNAVGLDGTSYPAGTRAWSYGGQVNTVRRHPVRAGQDRVDVVMEQPGADPWAPGAGQMVVTAAADEVFAVPCLTDPDEAMTILGTLAPWGDRSSRTHAAVQSPRTSAPHPRFGLSAPGTTWLAGLYAHVRVDPGDQRPVRFAWSWRFPNRTLDFVQFGPERPQLGPTRFWLGNHYATQWPDAVSVADRVLAEWDTDSATTSRWVSALREMGRGDAWTEHLSAQLVPLRSPTVFRTADGHTYGFEGVLGASTTMWSGDSGGSCPLNCTHVWGYAQAGAAIFGELEADMRATELALMQNPDGSINHRVQLPRFVPQDRSGVIGGPDAPALDGMLTTVLKVLRELQSGHLSKAWLAEHWDALTALMDHVSTTWDAEETGLLHGVQPSTYDIALHGPNPYMGILWLCALKAAERLAALVADNEREAAFAAQFAHASHVHDRELFRGGWYVQRPDPDDDPVHHWGQGCLTDQLLGQWWAHLLGLGHLLPADHVRQAASSIVRHNLLPGSSSGQRQFCLPDERGLRVCAWPLDDRPAQPIEYCDETWTGSEYAVAALCLFEGLAAEAEQVLEAVWHRHDGQRRSPYNEVECGDHYARSMSGWSLVAAASRMHWDALTATLEVDRSGTWPLVTTTGWGQVIVPASGLPRLLCHHGRLPAMTIVGRHGTMSHPPLTAQET